VLSASIISSGSAPAGLTTALSGDVVLPSVAPRSGDIVLIDRYPNAVVTWVDPRTANVDRQLSVGTGFASNPHDYLEVSETKAYVTRYESNANAGRQPNDAGGDILIVDPRRPEITGRISLSMPGDGALFPRADRMLRVGNDVWVILQRFDANFKTAGDARIVGVSIDDDAVVWSHDLSGVASCGAVAVSPSGRVVALSCTGVVTDADPSQRSAIVLLDATVRPPVDLATLGAASQLAAPLGASLAYAGESLLFGVVVGDRNAGRSDHAFTLDPTVGKAEVIADAGAAFAFGDVRCLPGCNDLCFLADARAGALRVWKAVGSWLEPLASLPVDRSLGLPPRYIGDL
jgi:hypothetical protein